MCVCARVCVCLSDVLIDRLHAHDPQSACSIRCQPKEATVLSTVLYSALQCSTVLSTVLYSALQCYSALYSALQCSLQCSTVLYSATVLSTLLSTLLYTALHCSTVLYSALQCSVRLAGCNHVATLSREFLQCISFRSLFLEGYIRNGRNARMIHYLYRKICPAVRTLCCNRPHSVHATML